jgi:hypothetical protein
LRKNLRGFGVGGGGMEAVGGGGDVLTGSFWAGMVAELGVVGVVAVLELNGVATGDAGEVVELAEPGRTTGFESAMVGF